MSGGASSKPARLSRAVAQGLMAFATVASVGLLGHWIFGLQLGQVLLTATVMGGTYALLNFFLSPRRPSDRRVR